MRCETQLLNQIVKTVHKSIGELQNVHVRGASGHKETLMLTMKC